MSVVHLCQDCLAIVRLPQYEGDALCACGSELCGCPPCVAVAFALQDGERDRHALELQEPDGPPLEFWCEATGIHRPTS